MSIASGLAWSYFERWGNRLISLAVFIVIARLLSPEVFGLVVFAKVFIDYLDSVSGQGMGFALIQRKEVSPKHLDSAFWINAGLGAVLTLVIYLAAPLIEIIFSTPGLADVLRPLSILILINSLSRVQVAILTRDQKFRLLALRGLTISVAGGVVGIAFAVKGYGVWSLILQQIVGATIALFLLWGATTWRPQARVCLECSADLYRYASRVAVEQQVIFISKRLDEFLVASLLGTSALGVYGVAKRLADTLSELVYGALIKVLMPAFSKMQGDLGAMTGKLAEVTRYVSALSFPIFIFAAALADEIVVTIVGVQWVAAGTPLSVLLLACVFLLTPNLIHSLFHALGQPEVPLKLNTIRSLVLAIAVTIGGFFGLLGVAFASFARNFLGAVIDLRYYRRIQPAASWECFSIQGRYLLYAAFASGSIPILRSLNPIQNTGIEFIVTGAAAAWLTYLMVFVLTQDRLWSTVKNRQR